MHPVWFSSALAMALIGPLGETADEQSVAPNLSNPETEVLELDKDRARRFTIPVTIDGSGPYDFMIDTGSQATAVTHEINQHLQLEPLGMATLVGMASRRQVELVELDSLEVGNQVIHNVHAPVLYRNHVGADGIIGLDSLQDFRVMIDFRKETITVEDVTKKSSRRGFEIVVRARSKLGQLLITNADIDGVRTTVIIDTGAQASLGNMALREKIRARRQKEVETTDVNGVSLLGQLSYARKLTIQDIVFTDVPITYADAPAFEALGLKDKPVLSLGMSHLRLFDRVAIDFSKQRIMFDLPRSVRRSTYSPSQSKL